MADIVRSWQMFAGRFTNDRWLNVESSAFGVRLYGGDPERVTVIEDPEGDYYGWIAADSDTPIMIQPHEGMFSMQFPYGPKAEVDRGKGTVVRLKVEPMIDGSGHS